MWCKEKSSFFVFLTKDVLCFGDSLFISLRHYEGCKKDPHMPFE